MFMMTNIVSIDPSNTMISISTRSMDFVSVGDMSSTITSLVSIVISSIVEIAFTCPVSVVITSNVEFTSTTKERIVPRQKMWRRCCCYG